MLHSLSCTMPHCTVLIRQEVVATLFQLAYLTFSIACPSQQSQWVKPPNDSPGRPLVPVAASGAGSGPGGKMIGKKKRCRSAQTRHLFKKPVRSKSGAHSPFPWLLLVATSRELIWESPWKESGGTSQRRWQWVVEGKKNSVLEVVLLTLISNFEKDMTSLPVIYAQSVISKNSNSHWINPRNEAAGVYSKSIKPVEHCRWLH